MNVETGSGWLMMPQNLDGKENASTRAKRIIRVEAQRRVGNWVRNAAHRIAISGAQMFQLSEGQERISTSSQRADQPHG
jgi:hypothetical protein